MKKIILISIIFILMFSTVGNTQEYFTEKNEYRISVENPVLSGVYDWKFLAANRHNDSILLLNGGTGTKAFYDYNGNRISKDFNKIVYVSDAPGGSIYLVVSYGLCPVDSPDYEAFLRLVEMGGKDYRKVDEGIEFEVYDLYNHKGELLLSDEYIWEFEFEKLSESPHAGELFARALGEKEYYWFDRLNNRLTGILRPEDRFEKREAGGFSNYYDTVSGKCMFEENYEDVNLRFINGIYYFLLSKDGIIKVEAIDGLTGETVKNEAFKKTFNGYETHKLFLYTLHDKKTITNILELSAGEDSVYIDEWGIIRNKQWFDDVKTPFPDNHSINFHQHLPDGMEIKYGKLIKLPYYEYRPKKVFSQGREIIQEITDEITYLDGYYFYCYDYEAGGGVFDIEGNFVMEVPSTRNYHIKDNCFYTIGADDKNVVIYEIKIINPAPKIYINGEFMLTDTLPRIKNGRTLVPLRAFAEMMEFQVKEPDEKGRIEISKEGKTVAFTLGSLEAEANGKKIKLEAAPEIINNRTLVPVRALAEAFECEVEWNGETTEVVISN